MTDGNKNDHFISSFSRVLVILFCLLASHRSFAAGNEPFEIRGWDIERYDPNYVRDAIHRAHEAGMNTISLSHEVVMNAEEILHDWHRYQHLQDFCELAHREGTKIYFWNHQLNNPPELLITHGEGKARALDFDNPVLKQFLYDRYQRVVDRVPSVDGIILSLTESEWQVHREGASGARGGARIVSRMKPSERMAMVINTVHDSLKARRKQLIVRDFLRSPAEMNTFVTALQSVPEDVWVYSKCVPNDWEYRYPPHPLLGKLSPRKQIMELDCYKETGGNHRIAMLAPDYYQTQLKMARDHGLAGAIARTDDGFRSNLGTPGEFNVYAYSRLLHAPDADVEAMWPAFFDPIYGAKTAPTAISCLKETFPLVCAITYTLGFWTGSGAPNIAYTDDHLVNNSSALWSNDPQYKETERLLLISGPDTIHRTVEEKHEARETASRCLTMLDKASAAADSDQMRILRGYFEEARQQARIGEIWARAYFALRWYRNTQLREARSETQAALEASESFVLENQKILHDAPNRLSAYVQRLTPLDRERFFNANMPAFNSQLRKEMQRIASTSPIR